MPRKRKKTLSTVDHFSKELNSYQLELSKEIFDSLVEPIAQKTIDCCKKAVKDAEIDLSEIDKVVMVGGSTRTPLIKATSKSIFSKKKFTII